MRIIAGVAKGRNLGQVAESTRPTSDRAREAIFSSIHSEFGDLSNLKFLDLYAGSGAMGLEALSRGFFRVDAVENNDSACKTIKQNFELVQRANPPGIFQLHVGSVTKFLTNTTPQKYDVVFLDPPFEKENIELGDEIRLLINNKFLNSGALIVMERPSKGSEFIWPEPLKSTRAREYGTAAFYFATYEM